MAFDVLCHHETMLAITVFMLIKIIKKKQHWLSMCVCVCWQIHITVSSRYCVCVCFASVAFCLCCSAVSRFEFALIVQLCVVAFVYAFRVCLVLS